MNYGSNYDAQHERDVRRRIGRFAPEIAVRNLLLPGSSQRSSRREKASDVYTHLVAGIVPNDGHRAGYRNKSRAETETSRLLKRPSCGTWSKVFIFEKQANLSLLWQARPF